MKPIPLPVTSSELSPGPEIGLSLWVLATGLTGAVCLFEEWSLPGVWGHSVRVTGAIIVTENFTDVRFKEMLPPLPLLDPQPCTRYSYCNYYRSERDDSLSVCVAPGCECQALAQHTRPDLCRCSRFWACDGWDLQYVGQRLGASDSVTRPV